MKLRARYVKLGKVRWTSHRDVARMWERAFRRVRLPLAYTGGFSPRPKVSFGLALPTGAESQAEYLDLELDETRLGNERPDLDLDLLAAELSAALPVGVDVTALAPLAAGEGSLQQEVTSCEWEIGLDGVTGAQLDELVASALAATSLPVTRERKGRVVEDDVRPAVVWLRAAGTELTCELRTQPRGLRPAELVAALSPRLEIGRVCRTSQWIERDGARRDPLPAAATDARRGTEPRVSERDEPDDRTGRRPAGGAPPGASAVAIRARAALGAGTRA